MQSHWDRGNRPVRPRDERSYRAVSAFATREAAVRKATARNLGAYIAELEIPATTEHTDNPITGHVDLYGTTPEQLLGYVRHVWTVEEVG